MRNLFILIIILSSSGFSFGQDCKSSNVDLMCTKGLWKQVFLKDSDNDYSDSYNIMDLNKSLNLMFIKKENRVIVSVGYYGYLDTCLKVGDTLFFKDLKLKGRYFYAASEPKDQSLKNTLFSTKVHDQYCDEDRYEIGRGYFDRKFFIPDKYFHLIQVQGRIDKRDYINEFNLHPYSPYRKIKSEKVFLHSEPDEITKNFLKKDQQIVVIDEDYEWIKIETVGKKKITGWVKREEIE